MSIRIPEKLIQDWVEEFYSKQGYTVQREVNTPVGRIDHILYKSYPEWHRSNEKILIEVKDVKNIKHAIGQLQSYRLYHPDCTKLMCIYFSRDGKSRLIDSSYYTHKDISFNNIHSVVSIEELIRYGEDRNIWLLEERKKDQPLRDLEIESLETLKMTMIPSIILEENPMNLMW